MKTFYIVTLMAALSGQHLFAKTYTGEKVSHLNWNSCEAHDIQLLKINSAGYGKILKMKSNIKTRWPEFNLKEDHIHLEYKYRNSGVCIMAMECFNSFANEEIELDATCQDKKLKLDISPIGLF